MKTNNIMFDIQYIQMQVKDWHLKKEKLLNLWEKQKFLLLGTMNSTYANDEDEELKLIKEIKKILSEEINEFCDTFEFKNYRIDSSWFQEELKGMHHPVHNHGFGYSSVCYIEFDHEVHTPLLFQSPFLDTLTGLHYHHMPENVQSGTILFFPSIISHFTLPNQSEMSRKILSFNLKFFKELEG